MEYLLILTAVVAFALSYRNFMNYKKFYDSGRIPEIITAKRNTTVFLLLALFSICTFIIVELPFTVAL